MEDPIGMKDPIGKKDRIGLFLTCLVDLTRPQIAHATKNLLQCAGFQVTIPEQSCCGQPAYNSGHQSAASDIAKTTIKVFEGYDYIVTPSASCASHIKHHIPALFTKEPDWAEKARALGKKTYELTHFLFTIAEMNEVNTAYNGRIYYHESCSSRRESKSPAARALLSRIKGAEVLELGDNAACCGFGGLFSVSYPSLSNAMLNAKIAPLNQAEDAILTGLDLGCLLNIASKLKKEGLSIKAYHIAELLNGPLDQVAISDPET